ncbi:MAG: PaaI family thioesterase [Acidimicrobiales bacterium]
MSYPPAVHVLRDLGFVAHDDHTRMPVTAGLCDAHGLRLGALATLVDVSGAGIALRSVAPDWIATADLHIHVIRPVAGGDVTIRCRPLRLGARSVVVDAVIHDDDGAVCATGRMAFARIPGSATRVAVDDDGTPRPTGPMMDGGRPILDPVVEMCGMIPVGPGQLRVDKTPYIENSFGTVNGGVLALAAEAAAVSAAGDGWARDLHIHYLEQIGEGPVGVTAEVIRDDVDSKLCAVRIEDRSTNRLVAIADVVTSARRPSH